MNMLMIILMLAATALVAVALVAITGLQGFRAWIDLKRAELNAHAHPTETGGANRIELADMKERLRKLEAIAAGVDL